MATLYRTHTDISQHNSTALELTASCSHLYIVAILFPLLCCCTFHPYLMLPRCVLHALSYTVPCLFFLFLGDLLCVWVVLTYFFRPIFFFTFAYLYVILRFFHASFTISFLLVFGLKPFSPTLHPFLTHPPPCNSSFRNVEARLSRLLRSRTVGTRTRIDALTISFHYHLPRLCPPCSNCRLVSRSRLSSLCHSVPLPTIDHLAFYVYIISHLLSSTRSTDLYE